MLKLGRDNQPLLFQEQKRRPKWMMPYISTGEKSGTSPVWCLYFLLGSFEKVKYAIDKKNKLGKSYWVCFSTPPSKKKWLETDGDHEQAWGWGGASNGVGLVVASDSWTPWTVACQAHPSVGFPRQEYWIGLPFPSAGDLPNGVRKHEVFGKVIGLVWKFVEQYFTAWEWN